MSNENTGIWESVSKTDPAYTKEYSGAGGYSGTSINGHYMVMKATEVFGPIGIGWGYEIVEERYDTGGTIGMVDEIEVRAQTHTIRLKLWYEKDGKRGEVEHFGHTPYIYKTKRGIMSDSEAPKKSLTDALKKCLSMLGFAADIFLGQYDDIAYVNEISNEFKLEKAEDKIEEKTRQEQEYKNKMQTYRSQIESAVSMTELEALFKESVRKANFRKDTAMVRLLTELKEVAKVRLTDGEAA